MARPFAAPLAAALAAGLLCAATPAIAREDGPPPGGHGGRGPAGPEGFEGPRGPRLFISPSGEPFRGPDGLKRWFEAADADHDGALALEEFRADAMRFFKVLDADGDGVIDGIENQAYETKIAPEITGLGLADEREAAGPPADGEFPGPGRGGGMGRRGGGMGGRGPGEGRGFGGPPGLRGPRLEGAARFSLINEPQPVRGADANLDFKVSAAEWAKAAARRFALLDTAQTGRLTLDTLPPLPGQRRPKPRP